MAKHPHQKLFTDVSYVRINNKWCYISVVIDGFNAQVIDYQLSWHNKATLVIKNVKQALKVPIKHQLSILITCAVRIRSLQSNGEAGIVYPFYE